MRFPFILLSKNVSHTPSFIVQFNSLSWVAGFRVFEPMLKAYTQGIQNRTAGLRDGLHFYIRYGQVYKFHLRYPRVLLVIMQLLLLTCLVYSIASFVIVTPELWPQNIWYIPTCSKTIPAKIYKARIFFKICFLVSWINLIPSFLD